MPFPHHHVIPPGWENHHRPVSAHAMPDTCRITRPSTAAPVFDEVTAQTSYTPAAVIYDGPCRILQNRTQEAVVTVADQKVVQGRYLIVVPADSAPIQVDDVVAVTACTADPELAGQVLLAIGTRWGSSTFERVIPCQLRQAVTR